MAEKSLGIMGEPGRHDMAFLDDEAMAFARRAALKRNPGLSEADAERWLTADIPAIITRQTRRREDGLWEAGFSLPVQMDGVRLRFRTMIPMGGVTRLVTPFDAALGDLSAAGEKPRAVLAELLGLGAGCGLEVGVYGSLALQILTRRPYFTETSDYDIYLRVAGRDSAGQRPDAAAFYHGALALGEKHGVRIDMEIACLEDSGAKLAELFSGQKTVLCKGLYGVQICPLAELGLL